MSSVPHESAGFKRIRVLYWSMHCHYCDREAAFAAEHEGVKVGLCEEHFQEQIETLTDEDTMEALRERVDIDRTE